MIEENGQNSETDPILNKDSGEQKPEISTDEKMFADKNSKQTGVKKPKKKKIPVQQKAKQFWDDIWDIEKEFNRLLRPIVIIIKIITVTIHKFIKDDSLSRASAIAYTTIVSLVPTLTVGFSIFSAFEQFKEMKENFIRSADLYIREHNLNIDITPFANIINNLTDNAAGIGGIGLLVLIFSATAVLRTMEKTFNDIWKVKVQRSILMKVIYYWGALTLGPLLLATGGSLAGIMANIFTMPTIVDVQTVNQKVLMVGDRGFISISDTKFKKREHLDYQNVDFENQRKLLLNREENNEDLSLVGSDETNLNKITIKDVKKASFSAVAVYDQSIWVASKEGFLLHTKDSGKRWSLQQIGQRSFAGNFNGLEINDIYFLDAKNGFITAGNFTLLRTRDGGKNWQKIKVDLPELDLSLLRSSLTRIYFRNYGEGYILTNKGAYLKSQDGGQSWKAVMVAEARESRQVYALNDISINKQGEMWIVGSDGLILYSQNNGKSWFKRSKGEFAYNSVLAFDKSKVVIAGNEGYFLYSDDAGERWNRIKQSGWNYNRVFNYGKDIYASGENMSVYIAKIQQNGTVVWHRIIGGKNFWYSVINFLAPFAVIWILFIVAYLTLPNTKIPIKAAAIGASVTSAVWVIFILSFTFYVKNLTGGTQAIYGALAIIPIFLLMVYASAVIILFGAELTYTIQHPASYQNRRGFKRVKLEEHYLFDGVYVLYTIFKNFEAGKGATSEHKLQHLINSNPEVLPFLLDLYLEKGYIKETNNFNEYLPAQSGDLIRLDDVVDLALTYSYQIPNYKSSNPIMEFFKEKFDQLEDYRDAMLKPYTLEKLVRDIDKIEKPA